ncbi:MAG: T9SS C-terminal target domain-containing protein [Saprospiraceae bacterium]|nr:T9SS C-terminal target domain-containing protein [Saprospiraceae bacterium]
MTGTEPVIPEDYSLLYVLTRGEDLIIEGVNAEPHFDISEGGSYTIHTLVYDPATLDLSIVVPGETTGFDVNGLLVQGGGSICASLDVAGAKFDVTAPSAGTLTGGESVSCGTGVIELIATHDDMPVVPAGYETIYVLTRGSALTIIGVNDLPQFSVETSGHYTIHTLVYDPATLDLGIVETGVTTGFDVNSLLVQGGGSICASLDVAGATYSIGPDAGTLVEVSGSCLDGGTAHLAADILEDPIIPEGFESLYVLTSGADLIIEQVNEIPEFEVTGEGRFTIHTLIYDPMTLDLTIITPGETTGVDVNNLLVQGGGSICGSLDVAGAVFEVINPQAGTLAADSDFVCFDGTSAEISATVQGDQVIPEGYSQLFVLTSGDALIIEQVGPNPVFNVTQGGLYTIHTLIYDPATLDLSIVVPGETSGVDVNGLLVQGGGSVCASLDVTGAPVIVGPYAGTLSADNPTAQLNSMSTILSATQDLEPFVPTGYSQIYVLTSGEELTIENVGSLPQFDVSAPGIYTIHTLIYDPMTLDLGIVEIGVTTGVDVNSLLVQGGGEICAALDVEGARFEVSGDQKMAGDNSINLQQLIFNDPVLTVWVESQNGGESLLNIFDQYGRLLGQQRFEMFTGSNQIQVNLNENSPASLYFIQINDQTLKVVKSW